MDRKRIAKILASGQRGSWRGMRRDHAKLTQTELAQRAGVSRPSVQAFESGRSVSQQVRDKVRWALAEAIVEREDEERLLKVLNLTTWGVVESYVRDLRARIDSGELDEDTALKALGHLIERLQKGVRA
jgi:transcriptional regulator with XRE-family HTH domain